MGWPPEPVWLPGVWSRAGSVELGPGSDLCATAGQHLRSGAASGCTASLRWLSLPLTGETATEFTMCHPFYICLINPLARPTPTIQRQLSSNSPHNNIMQLNDTLLENQQRQELSHFLLPAGFVYNYAGWPGLLMSLVS